MFLSVPMRREALRGLRDSKCECDLPFHFTSYFLFKGVELFKIFHRTIFSLKYCGFV